MRVFIAIMTAAMFTCAPLLAGPLEDAQQEAARGNHKPLNDLYMAMAMDGIPEAQAQVGNSYYLGLGRPQNYAEAIQWYQKAADQGYGRGQLSLGLMFLMGYGVDRDYVQAHKWFNLASVNADTAEWRQKAIEGRERAASYMTPKQIAEAQRLATQWTRK